MGRPASAAVPGAIAHIPLLFPSMHGRGCDKITHGTPPQRSTPQVVDQRDAAPHSWGSASAPQKLIRFALALLPCTLSALFIPGCGGFGSASASGNTSIRSESGAALLATDLPTRIYRHYDANTADIYLTDLPSEVWTAGADVSNATGIIIHIRHFMRPDAGDTPISTDASTASVRVLVLASGELGLYGGGGFMRPAGRSGADVFGGTITDGTLRLSRHTAGFADRLGPSRVNGSFGATKDEAQAKLIDRAMRSLIAHTRFVEPPEPATDVTPTDQPAPQTP